MASQDNYICGTGANDATVGTEAWSNPTNIQADDGTYATVPLTDFNMQSNYIKGSNFSHTVPTGSTILGIKFTFELSRAALAAGTVVIISAKCGKGGTIGGSEKAASEEINTTDTYYTFGGIADLHGLTLSPADVNASNFLAVCSLKVTVTASGNNQCDVCKNTVYYTDIGEIITAVHPPMDQPQAREPAIIVSYFGRPMVELFGRLWPIYSQTRAAKCLQPCFS